VTAPDDLTRRTLVRRGFALEWCTLGWNVAGIVVLAFAAITARSVALAGFGLDSLIEIGASTVVIWELSGTGAGRQRRGLRLIGYAFAALAAYLLVQSTVVLATGYHPRHSVLGIIWTAVTAVVMFTLATGKASAGRALDNPVLRTEGRVTVIDGILAVAVLVGLVLNAVAGWWWADPAAGYVLVYYAAREVREIFTDHADPELRAGADRRGGGPEPAGGSRRPTGTVWPVTDPSGFASRSRLTFHGPLSAERADRLAAGLADHGPETVADYGCGWGELLLRVLEAAPSARGLGVDVHGPDIARARENAGRRGLAGRAAFIEGPAADHAGHADAVVNCGAYQAFGSIPVALKALRALVNPGGRVLFGAEIWDRTPTERQLSAMWPGTTLETCLYLPDVVGAAVEAGFRPLRIETATLGEWDEFESGLATGAEEWLLANPDHPEAGQVRDKLDTHLSIWLRGHRDVMGFAYLTLGAP